MNRKIIDLITDVVPTSSVKQSTNVLYSTFKKKHAGIDHKKNMVQAHKMTTKHSDITIKQHFCWFPPYEAAFFFKRKTNTGVFKATGRAFGELIQ